VSLFVVPLSGQPANVGRTASKREPAAHFGITAQNRLVLPGERRVVLFRHPSVSRPVPLGPLCKSPNYDEKMFRTSSPMYAPLRILLIEDDAYFIALVQRCLSSEPRAAFVLHWTV
jgi:hypothetical protein